MKKTFVSLLIAAALMATSPAAFAGIGEPSDHYILVPGALMTGDLLIVRPLSVADKHFSTTVLPF